MQPRNQATDTFITDKYGKELRQVTELRDTYVTTACALCEQLKANLKTLKSLEKKDRLRLRENDTCHRNFISKQDAA